MHDWLDLRQRTAWQLLAVFALLSGAITYFTVGDFAKGMMTLSLILYNILTLPLIFGLLVASAICGSWVLIAVLLFLQRRVGLWGLSIFCTLKSVVYALILWAFARVSRGFTPETQASLAQRFPHYRETRFWLGCVVLIYGTVAVALWHFLLTRRPQTESSVAVPE